MEVGTSDWSLTLDLSTYNRRGHGDNWPSVWAADGNHYTIFADGSGFDGGSFLSFGWAQLHGTSGASWSGSEPASNGNIPIGSGACGRKASGLLAVDSILYAAVRNVGADCSGTESILRRSTDNGLNWEWASWKWPEFGYPFLVQHGQAHSGGDGFVYMMTPTTDSAYQKASGLWLARVPEASVFDQSAWRYWTGSGWSADRSQRASVITWSPGLFRPSAFWHPTLERYVLLSMLDTGASARTDRDALYVFEADALTGPWRLVYRNDDFDDLWSDDRDRDPFQPHLPLYWLDGLDGWLVYSCCPGTSAYSLNAFKVSFVPRDGATPTPTASPTASPTPTPTPTASPTPTLAPTPTPTASPTPTPTPTASPTPTPAPTPTPTPGS